MKNLRKIFLRYVIATAITMAFLSSFAYGQFSISISGPSATQFPDDSFDITATVTIGSPNVLDKIVFYRNDVPYRTISPPFNPIKKITEEEIGQDTYIYRARAYNTDGEWVESSDFEVIVETPRILKMGSSTIINHPLRTSNGTVPMTTGPNRYKDHTNEIIAAIEYLRDQEGGGTLYFPCTGDTHLYQSIYNISDTITVPSNVTIQGESSQAGGVGRCRIYWNNKVDLAPHPCQTVSDPALQNKPMFKVLGGTKNVRFRDIWLWSRTSGRDCIPSGSYFSTLATIIKGDNTAAIALYGVEDNIEGDISDVIFENISINEFTYGIKATTCTNPDWVDSDYDNSSPTACRAETDYEIRDIKFRGYRPASNFRQLYINAKHAYDWDIQNLNVNSMLEDQGAVEILEAGSPTEIPGEIRTLKFLQLNCNGNPDRTPAFCGRVKKHGGLYFKQLHHEGTNKSLIVEDISIGSNPQTNPDKIIFEQSVATGEFKDASMQLYLIGNSVFAAPVVPQPGLDEGRLNFIGGGLDANLVDCGDVNWDITDVVWETDEQGNPLPNNIPHWEDFHMLFSHTERNRESFFSIDGAKRYPKAHTPCPAEIKTIGGEHFNIGVMPVWEESANPADPKLYSTVLKETDCVDSFTMVNTCAEYLNALLIDPNNRGTIYIEGSVTVKDTIYLNCGLPDCTDGSDIHTGRQIFGGENSELVLDANNKNLLEILIKVGTDTTPRTSGISIRNLKLKTTGTDNTGLAIKGDTSTSIPGTSSDMHFSGLVFEGFKKGLEVARYNENTAHPMIDGLSWKNISFINNQTAARIQSSNLSNWNLMNLSIKSSDPGANGWYQITSGNSMQNVSCEGDETNNMEHCIKLDMAGTYLTGFKRSLFVTNALTFGKNLTYYPPPYTARQFSHSVLRNNDFSSDTEETSQVNFKGKTFLTSMNNQYTNFATGSTYEGDLSRVTHCGDSFKDKNESSKFTGLETDHMNYYVGVPTPTRIECGINPKPWEDVINLGGEAEDKPFVGNFFSDVQEDMVIYREGFPSQFLIKSVDGKTSTSINWGLSHSNPGKRDIPLVGNLIAGSRAQIVIWRPSDGTWWVYDRNCDSNNTNCSPNTYVWHWGMDGDIPFIGNFFDENGPTDTDEIAIYRPSTQTFWIFNPHSAEIWSVPRGTDYGDIIKIADFNGSGHDQIAQYKLDGSGNGNWNIYDPISATNNNYQFGENNDIPVPGKFLDGQYAQLAVWRPSEQKFIVMDQTSSCISCEVELVWGSNNDYGNPSTYPDDIPLKINTADGSLDRPVAYRPFQGEFPYFPFSLSNGQWWIHDPF